MASHPKAIFVCPNCGKRDNQDIAFICNTCDIREAKHVEGLWVCPECETHSHPFECRICESKEVAFLSPLYEESEKEINQQS